MSMFKFLNFFTSKAETILKKENFKTYSEDEIKISAREVGAKVEMVDAEGNLQPLEDGTYEMSDGFIFICKDGLIEEIEGQEQPADEVPKEEMAEEAPAEEAPADTSDELIAIINKISETVNKVIEKVDAIQSQIDSMKGNNSQADEMAEMKTQMGAMYNAVKVFASIPVQESKIVKTTTVTDLKEAKRMEMMKVLHSLNK